MGQDNAASHIIRSTARFGCGTQRRPKPSPLAPLCPDREAARSYSRTLLRCYLAYRHRDWRSPRV